MCPWCNASVVSCWGVPVWWCMILGSYCVVWRQKMYALKSPMSLVMSNTSIFVWRGLRTDPPAPNPHAPPPIEIYARLTPLFSMAVWCPLLNGNIVFEISKPDMPCITFSRISLLHWRLILKVTQDWRQREDAGSGFWPFISPIDYITKCPKLNTNLGYVNTITDNFCAASKTIPDMIGLVFTHKNGDSAVISVMLQGCAVSCRSLKWRVTSWIGLHTIPGSFCACAGTKTIPDKSSVHT